MGRTTARRSVLFLRRAFASLTRILLKSSQLLHVAGHDIEYAREEPATPGRQTLVLLHEALGCVRRWKGWPRQLVQATGCPVFAYSRPGFGTSSRAPERPRNYLHIQALEILPAVLDAADIGDHVLVGHSDGASIAALNSGEVRDARLRGVVQIAPHFVVEEKALEGIRAARQAWETTDLRARLTRYHGDQTDEVFNGWSDRWLDPAFREWDITPSMAKVEVPTLLLQGDDDRYGTLLHFELARRVAKCRLEEVVLPGIGHSPHLEAPQQTTDAVARFIASL